VILAVATVTLTATLRALSGPSTRKIAVAARGGLDNLNAPYGPVTPVAMSSN
jgi:hypothetical protein